MLAQGTPLHVVSEILGHSSIVMTKDVYGHLEEGSKRQASALLSGALFGADPARQPAPLATNLATNRRSDDSGPSRAKG